MGEVSFTQQLRRENEHWFQSIYEHPYVVGIRKGQLSRNQLIHYVKQDMLYLDAYIRLYGAALSKCRTREEMMFFHNGISFILNDEVQPHHNLCRAAGVTSEQIRTDRLAGATRHYINHMLTTAQTGTLEQLYAAMLPCPWTYEYAAKRMLQEEPPADDHPYGEWIRFYGERSSPTHTELLGAKLDEAAQGLRSVELERLKEAFAMSCEMELRFWEMAYTLED